MRSAYRRKATPKYKNTATTVNGIKFDSAKEASRHSVLVLLQHAGEIADLQRQVSFELIPKQKNADGKTEVCVRYVADFVYTKDSQKIVEDVKSDITRKLPAYVIKRKLMLDRHGITIKEV